MKYAGVSVCLCASSAPLLARQGAETCLRRYRPVLMASRTCGCNWGVGEAEVYVCISKLVAKLRRGIHNPLCPNI
jgi:hypothetical protein